MPLRERSTPPWPGRRHGPGDIFRAVRRKVLTPSTAQTRFDIRGFHEKDAVSRYLLEAVGHAFLEGYGIAVGSRSMRDTIAQLASIPDQFRGFAYEGAGMGLAILDSLRMRGSCRIAQLLQTEPGAEQRYLVYVGIGWAMARLPRFCWPRAKRMDPLLRWLVLDGYGFHQGYFHTRKYVHEQHQNLSLSWPDKACGRYANRVVDQGIGRAIWFVGGTDPDEVAAIIEKFPEMRRSDLYSGAGLAATYAGGVTREELVRFRGHAGAHLPALAQGSAFAAEARVSGGFVAPYTEHATSVFCGTTPENAARVTRETQPADPLDGDLPAYEAWRHATARCFGSTG
ncbi:DUF1702 family protein [Amycolatopsis sp. NPDC059021]|uniref:DUF1702 family protein n=1 Tax=Amycolatopsis sp. NPDC059021 TaxID=3346704 RepID=UPI0036706F5D